MNMTKRRTASVSTKEDRIAVTRDKMQHNNSSFSPGSNEKIENVLILQGGGSLGAFGCGVFKALSESNVKIDIVAGTSIGGVNAVLIAGNKNEKHPEQLLKNSG